MSRNPVGVQHELVINEAVQMCCGRPSAYCRCSTDDDTDLLLDVPTENDDFIHDIVRARDDKYASDKRSVARVLADQDAERVRQEKVRRAGLFDDPPPSGRPDLEMADPDEEDVAQENRRRLATNRNRGNRDEDQLDLPEMSDLDTLTVNTSDDDELLLPHPEDYR